MTTNSRPRDPRPSIRLLDYLTFPIAKPSHKALRRSRKTQDSAGQNGHTAAGQYIRIQRWRDFTYPVLRIALRDLLEYRPHDQALYNPGDAENSHTSAVAPFLQRLDFPVSALLNRVGRALHCTASLMQWQGEPSFEFEYLPPKPAAATYNTGRRRSVVQADREWHFHVHQGRRLVVGLVKSAVDEFPLSGLGVQSGGAGHEGVQRTLRQARAACRAGGADYGFVLTPEGAAVLCFRGAERCQEEEDGDVCFAVVPWTRAGAGDNVNHIPLTMALWALCVLAEAADRRVVGEGQQSPLPFPPPLNVWVPDGGGYGAQMYRHVWLRQKTRGLPPGAAVQRSLVDRVGVEVSEDVEKSQDTDTSGKAEEAEISGKAEETVVHVDNKSSRGKGKRKKKAAVNHVFVADGALESWSSRLRPRKRRPNYRL
ncbi:60s ribosomal protein l22 [Pestalotiopsis sp. IQ-011]